MQSLDSNPHFSQDPLPGIYDEPACQAWLKSKVLMMIEDVNDLQLFNESKNKGSLTLTLSLTVVTGET